MNVTLFKTITNKDKSEVVQKLITHSTPNQDFYLMVGLAVAVATLGLLLNNASIIIGSMLISPMLYAFLSLSLGFSISDNVLILRSAASIAKAALMGIVIAMVITFFTAHNNMTPTEIASFNPTLAYGLVALISGFAAAFTMAKPNLNETLPGIAIAVAIIPPIALAGIGLAVFRWDIFRDALMLFLLNTIAIFAGSFAVFSLMNLFVKKNLAAQTLAQEERKMVQAASNSASK